MKEMTWIRKTNQQWKMSLFYVLLVVASLFFAALLWEINFAGNEVPSLWVLDEVVLSLSFVGLGGLAFGIVFFLIRCPVCKRNIGRYVLSTKDARVWFTFLINLERCPLCESIDR